MYGSTCLTGISPAAQKAPEPRQGVGR